MDLETLLQKYKNASEEEYRLVFLSALDKDQDGVVTSKDLKEVLRELNPGSGISDSDVADMIKMVDSKGVGAINFDDFMKALRSHSSNVGESQSLRAYAEFCRAQAEVEGTAPASTTLSGKFFRRVLTKIGSNRFTNEEVSEMFRSSGITDDSRISAEVFDKLMSCEDAS